MEKHQRPHRWALILLLAVLFSGDPLWATTIVVPGAWETTEGPSDNALPFSLGSSSSSARYQQVYDASAFSGLSGPQFVTAITFRRNGFSSVPFDFSEIIGLLAPVIHLSTTSASADGLSATFADNVGADDMVVKSGPFQLSSAPAPPRPTEAL